MVRKLTAASALALAFGGLLAPSAFATNGLTPATGEASASPHASPGRNSRAEVKQQALAARSNAAAAADVGEASGSAERPRTSATTREKVRQEARAARNERIASDGWQQVGGEGGTRSVPR